MNDATSTIIITPIATIGIVLVAIVTPVSTSVGAILTPVLTSVCDSGSAIRVVFLT
jgi:hypothetical protein